MLTTIITAAITALITGLITFSIQERRLRTEFKAEFMVEKAVKALLENEKWKKRSFNEIKKHIKGFSDNELRKILVRSGAVCFSSRSETELWGLLSRNSESL